MGALLSGPTFPTPPAPPPVPAMSDAAVQETTTDQLQRQALARGRASTFITDPSTQLSPEASRARTALGGA